MQIKRIELVGFKSFVEKTVLELQEGTTAVVGPNGCGKSNIVDAIRWAMGEQSAKSMRGAAMEDVIFAGSETRKPVGMAEVSLVFNNEGGPAPPTFGDRAEVMVTRRLFRSGESEYLLNQTPCRLLDITELFMDTGVGTRTYSIVEQGKIGLILNAKPEDRRFLIEEAAGVTKFKFRKKSALRKIEATKQNLLRLGDIVAEIRRQMNSLKRQAQKAERFKNYRDELKRIETRLAFERYQDLVGGIGSGGRQEESQKELLAGIVAELEAGQLRLETMRMERATREKEVSARQEDLFQLTGRIQRLEGDAEIARREAESLGHLQENLDLEKKDVLQSRDGLTLEEEETRRSIAQLGEDLRQARAEVDKVQSLLAEMLTEERDLAARLEEARKDLMALLTDLSRFTSVEAEMDRLDRSLQERTRRNRQEATELKERIEEVQQRVAADRQTLAGIKERRGDLEKNRKDQTELSESLRHQLAEKEERLLSLREEASRLRSRLDSLLQLEKNLEGYGAGVRLLLKEADFNDRLGGVIADAMDVPIRYEAAVEAVLSERLQALLAATPEDALEAGRLLADREARCTFLLPGFTHTTAPIQDATPLLGLIASRPDTSDVLRGLLGGVYLVADLAPFLSGPLPAGVTLVTEEGRVLTYRGELIAGGRQALDRGLLSQKREIKDLRKQLQAAEKKVADLQSLRERDRQSLAEAEGAARELEIALHQKALKVVDHEKDLERLIGEGERLQDRLEVLSLEEEQLHEEQESFKHQRLEASEGRSRLELERKGKEEKVAGLQDETGVLQEKTAALRDRVTAGKVAVAGLQEKEEAARHRLEQFESRRQEQKDRIDRLDRRWQEAGSNRELHHRRAEEFRSQRDELLAQLDGFKQRFEEARGRFDQENRQIDEQEKTLQAIRGRIDQTRQLLNERQLKNRELQMEAGHLCQAIEEKYRIDLTEYRPEEGEEFDQARMVERRDQLQGQIGDIGEVNLTSIEEFRDLDERYQFLTTQQEDLELSLKGLQTAIAKINRTTRTRFREAFDMVNQKFQEVFPRLFNGGRGELRMTDEEDLLETGIDIIVQPPGKKLQNVTLLSGGEKALAAVTLIFAIFLCKPTPFCILDEVDAPLDEANIGRFNEMVRFMTEQSQFVLITHNKQTMEIADTLYGVTMEEPGVSKIVSVRLNQY